MGLLIVDDFGISWDEAIQRVHGRVSLDYAAKKLGLDHQVLEPDHDLEDYQWSNYGMLYQMTASVLELALGLEDNPYSYYRLRHIMNLLLYVVALFFFYRTLLLRWPDRRWYPLLGTLILLLSPRIFGHAFFNPKDHVLLVFYLIATFTLLRYLKLRSGGALFWHIAATALALNTRLPVLLLVGATVTVLLWEQLHRPAKFRDLWVIPVYLIGSFTLMVPFFPYLWEDTLSRMIGAYTEMSDFKWGGYNLLFGDHLLATDLPAYYIPAWIVITTPLMYVILILCGLFVTLRNSLSGLRQARFWKDYFEQVDFVQMGLSVGPILVVIVLNSTLYNGWRHLHFVYPGLIFLSVGGFHALRRSFPLIAPALLGIGLAVTAIQMVRYHPHEYTYFNILISGDPILARFDVDYYGVGYRDALLKLAERIPEGEQRGVYCMNWPCNDNILSLPPAARTKLRIEYNREAADYLATNFLRPDERIDLKENSSFYANPIIEICPAGQLSIGVYDLKAKQ